jgi:DNA-binding winged helix-turn-helix (wHTH) protein
MVTAAGDTIDRVVGLESGADDYIAKPFEPRELLARVKSVLRRVGGMPEAGPRVRIGRRVLDLDRRVLIDPADGSEERLAASEFDLLKIFAENPNRPLMRDWLLEVTAHREADPFDRAIDLRITRLRRKVEIDPAHPEAIRTVRGVGYMFVPPKERSPSAAAGTVGIRLLRDLRFSPATACFPCAMTWKQVYAFLAEQIAQLEADGQRIADQLAMLREERARLGSRALYLAGGFTTS